jgi:hypothetical protein
MAAEPWGPAFKARADKGGADEPCVVCGKAAGASPLRAAASPCTGQFVAAAIVGTPAGDAIEAGFYNIGRECARAVRKDHPEAVVR